MVSVLASSAQAAVSWALSYLFVGGVIWMLLVDELRQSAHRRILLGLSPSFALASYETIIMWPAVLFRLAGKALGS